MPFIQARAKFTDGVNGRIDIEDSPILNVNNVPPTGNLGDWDYQDLTLEYQAGYAGSSCEMVLLSPSTADEVAQLKDIIINDPNGVVIATNTGITTNTGIGAVKITSTGRAGLVSFRFPAKFVSLVIWNNGGVVNGYSALKGFRSFGSTLRNVIIRISYSFEIPVNIPSTLKNVRFGYGNNGDGSVAFNDPKISNWDVSNLEAGSFDYMFAYCTNFNQDLSGWCVSQVTSPPIDFSTNSALTPANHPVWGTCPNPSLTSTAQWYRDANLTSPVGYTTNLRDTYCVFDLKNVKGGEVLELTGNATTLTVYTIDVTLLGDSSKLTSPIGFNTSYALYKSPDRGNIPMRTIPITIPKGITGNVRLVFKSSAFTLHHSLDSGSSSFNFILKHNNVQIGLIETVYRS